jgi:hypothetical protein
MTKKADKRIGAEEEGSRRQEAAGEHHDALIDALADQSRTQSRL